MTLLKLTDSLLTPGRVVFVYADQSYAAGLCSLASTLGIVIVPTTFGGGWIRDEILITYSTSGIIVHTPQLPSKTICKKTKSILLNIWEKEISHKSEKTFMSNVTGTICGSTLFDNLDDMSGIIQDSNSSYNVIKDGILLEGGNMLTDGHNVFIGECSVQLYSYMKKPVCRSVLSDTIPDKKCHVIPQFMWHLDLFICLLSNKQKTILIPELDEHKIDPLYMTSHKLMHTRKIFESLGYIVKTLDAFFFNDKPNKPRMSGAYLNSLAGVDSNDIPYILLPSFRHNAYIEQQLREIVDIGTNIHFIGDVLMNERELSTHGGALRCATAH
jgi:hypothetical protein